MANSQTVMLVIRSARPIFRNNHDKVAFVVHASFAPSGFRLVAIGRPAFAADALASSPTQGEVGIDGWNEFDEYAFVYAKGWKKFLVKCLAIDDNLLVDAVTEGSTEPAHLEIEVQKYAAESGVEGDYDAQFKNLEKLVTDMRDKILYNLDKGLKPVASTSPSSLESNKESKCGYYGRRRRPVPSGPPVIGGFGDGSMLVGPNDPRMFPGFGDRPDFIGPPQPGVPPPGGFYDPPPHIGPVFFPGFEPSPFRRQPPRRPEDVHPDLQHFCRGFGSFEHIFSKGKPF